MFKIEQSIGCNNCKYHDILDRVYTLELWLILNGHYKEYEGLEYGQGVIKCFFRPVTPR